MYEIGPFSHWTLFKGFWKYSPSSSGPWDFPLPTHLHLLCAEGEWKGLPRSPPLASDFWDQPVGGRRPEGRAEQSEQMHHLLHPLPANSSDGWPPSASTQPPSGSPLFPQSLLGLRLVSLLHLLTPPGWGELSAPHCYRPWVLPSPSCLLSYLSHDLVWPLLNFAQITLWVSHLFPVRTSPEEEAKLSNPSFHPLTFPALTPQTVIPPKSPWHSPTTSSPSPAHPGLWLWSSPLSGEAAFSSPHTQILLSFQDPWRIPPLHDSTTEDLAIISGLPSAWATVWIKQSIMAMSYKLTHHPLISDSLQ